MSDTVHDRRAAEIEAGTRHLACTLDDMIADAEARLAERPTDALKHTLSVLRQLKINPSAGATHQREMEF